MNCKKIMGLIAFGVLLFAAAMHLGDVFLFLEEMIALSLPLLIGLIAAFVLNVPATGLEKRFGALAVKMKKKPSEKAIRGISVLCTLLFIILVIALAATMVVPALTNSVKSVIPLIKEKWPKWAAILRSYQIDVSMLNEYFNQMDLSTFTGSAGNLLGSAWQVATSTISGITSVVFGLVIAVYVLSDKKKLCMQTKKLCYAHLKRPIADRLCHIAGLASNTYRKFLSGQCVEAIILGSLIFLAYSVFGLPYAGLIGFLTGIFAFVPYIGAFAACVIGVFLTLLVAPQKVLIGIIAYVVVQFIENQFIYPRVVGTSVGLSPLWTVVAALIGGKLLGLIGIIFFIPLVAVMYVLVKEHTNRLLKEKNIVLEEK